MENFYITSYKKEGEYGIVSAYTLQTSTEYRTIRRNITREYYRYYYFFIVKEQGQIYFNPSYSPKSNYITPWYSISNSTKEHKWR